MVKEKLESDCLLCKTHLLKNEMISLSVRYKRGEMAKQLAYMCKKCFLGFCKEHNIKIPKLEE